MVESLLTEEEEKVEKNLLFNKFMKFCSINKSEFKDRHSENRFKCNLFILFSVSNGLDFSRYGIVVTKKSGNAVQRNRIRRWVKNSLYSNIKSSELSGFDHILVVNRYYDFNRANFHLIDRNIKDAFTHINK